MASLIQREMEHAQRGEKGHLIFKECLVDRPIIQLLYQASQAGVKIDLLARGICCLRPGVKNLSENIQVISVVGRFLEHSRIYYFHNAGNSEIFLGSADLMPRNINRRVEVLFPVQDARLVQYLREEVLDTYLSDNVKARRMLPDGSYERVKTDPKKPLINSQFWLLNRHQRAQKG
jgi:polyphosphate kinase